MIHVLGSINIDYSCAVPALPGTGETVIGKSLFLTPGGKGANQALAARRAGAQVKMTGAIGSDNVASQATSLLQADGVDLSEVAIVPGPTGCAFVFVDDQSENQIVVVPGANAMVSEQQALQMRLSSKDVLLLQLEVPVPAVCLAAQQAHQASATVIANLAPYQKMPDSFFEYVDLLLLNETEAAQLCLDLDIDVSSDIAPELATRLDTGVVLTLGKKGVKCVDHEGNVSVLAGINVSAVDTVGAGDTFAGYLGYMISEGHSLINACKTANAAAALACTKTGAQTAIPAREELPG